MNLFIKKTGFYCSCFLLIILVLEFYILPNTNNIMSFKKSLIIDNNDLKILILGNSHTFIGIDPEHLTLKAINIANDSRKIETDFYILRDNIKKLQSIEFVIIPISFYSLFIDNVSTTEKRLYYHFYKLKDYNQSFFENRLIGNVSISEHINNILMKYDGAENISTFL